MIPPPHLTLGVARREGGLDEGGRVARAGDFRDTKQGRGRPTEGSRPQTAVKAPPRRQAADIGRRFACGLVPEEERLGDPPSGSRSPRAQ